MTLFGIDVSRWEVERPDPLDLALVKAAGCSWVNIALSGSKGNVSGAWAGQYADRARALGLEVCCYHWLTGAGTGAEQARWAYTRMQQIGATGYQVDAEDPTITQQVWREHVDTMQRQLGRHVINYTGDWRWGEWGWRGADLTPYLWAAPNDGYLPAYPGDDSPHWLAGYGGWPTLAVMQYTDRALIGSVRCALSAVRDPLAWADLTGAPMRIPGVPYIQGRNAYTDQDSQKFGIAIHDTSNNATARGEAAYAQTRTDGVSSHFYVDSTEIIQSLDTSSKAGHAGSAQGNENAIAVEITGQDGWTRAQWLDAVAWDKLGYVCAVLCQHYGIAVRRASVAEMQANPKVKAFYGHNDMRLAWGGTTHTDPGSNFPWDRLFQAVTTALSGDDMSTADSLRLKLLAENWNPTRQEWVTAGGDPLRFDALVADGSNPAMPNVLGATLAAVDKNVRDLTDVVQMLRDKPTQVQVSLSDADRAAIVQALAGAVQAIHVPTLQEIEDAAYRGANRAEDS